MTAAVDSGQDLSAGAHLHPTLPFHVCFCMYSIKRAWTLHLYEIYHCARMTRQQYVLSSVHATWGAITQHIGCTC